ncbi:MAG: putative Ig domain-containing protein, partial [Gammaproteobacteria bacterium]|nr:putative Ig domain-containing protein [Gammaproteobacteria bacterium]
LTGNAGTYPTTVTVTDNGSPLMSDSETFDIVVNSSAANQAPRLSNIRNESVTEGATLIQPISATDRDGDILAFSTTGLPVFCVLADFGDGSGEITCSPGSTDAGVYQIAVIVTDDGTPNLSDSKNYTLTVIDAANQAPVLAPIGNQSVDENASLVFPLSATDADGNSLAFSTTSLPAFCNLTDNLNGTGSVSCNPLTGSAGTYPTTVTVTDNGTPVLGDSETFDIVVNNVNAAPVLNPIGDQTAKENRTRVFDLIATDPDGNTLSFATSGLPGFCALTDNGDGTGEISCSPTGLDVGTYPITVTATDNGSPVLSDSETFNIIVLARSTMHDMNGDGMSDILWRNQVTGQNWLYLMNAASITNSAGINTVSPEWHIVGNGDYADDGNNDILWRNSLTGQNWMYRMSGATIVDSLDVNSISDTNWQVVGNGDFDGDGRADILWRNNSTGQNWLYLMNGAIIIQSAGINTVSDLNWEIAGNGDFDGDGKSDILWRNTATGQNWLYLMNGATITSSVGINTVNPDWQLAGNGDFDGDGKSDMLWRNGVTGQVWLYLMNGATIMSSAGISTISLDWQISGNGDYNGDSMSDILWRNRVTGQNWLYLMNGATIAGSAGVNTIGDLNWKIVNVD